MRSCPPKIYDAIVVAWAIVGSAARPTGNTVHSVGGEVIGPVAGLAICSTTDGHGFYLFYCGPKWDEITDTWHQSVDDAKAQAEFEYHGISSLWQRPAGPGASADGEGM